MGAECVIDSGGLALAGYHARPAVEPGAALPTLVLAHGFPRGPGGAAISGRTYPALADRLSADTGWAVLSFNFRGAGASPGNFALGGWLSDMRAAVDHAEKTGASGIWLAGASTGGSLAICEAATDPRVRGVAALAPPASFAAWAASPRRFLEEARQVGVITDAGFPPDLDAWGREFSAVRPLEMVARLAPRPLLIVYGTDDETVPATDVRALATAAKSDHAELRVLSGAGHRLRHDPRTVALVIGWMERQAAI